MRNNNTRFSMNPTSIDISRSRFSRPSSIKLSGNIGEILPFYVDEILPGDSTKIKTSFVCRLQTLVAPIMDNIFIDTMYFFVPNRLVWSHWKNLMGENSDSAWVPSTQYTVPQITSPSGGWDVGTIADYLGIPPKVDNISVNALPIRAYAKIIDDWFRDENLQSPLLIPTDETTVTGVNTGIFVSDVAKGGKPYIAGKFHDYFTSALPGPQKGPDVPLPLGNLAPVLTGSNRPITDFPQSYGDVIPMVLRKKDGTSTASTLMTNSTGAVVTTTSSGSANSVVTPVNLWSDLSKATGTSINQLRLAFQTQKLYEKDARGGSRYIELIKSHFGVTSPDARLQRAEYLGGSRTPININQVIQNSSTDSTSPQGHTTAYSLTIKSHDDVTKSFTEHGFLIGVCVLRYDHTYQQGLERFWSRKDRFDYYWPVFSNISEVGIRNSELYLQGSTVVNPVSGKAYDDEIFGYQEAWADYRYKPSRVSGEMRSIANTSLDIWHLADEYNSLPSLSDSWIREDKSNVDRSLSVTSSVSNQFFADFYVNNIMTRPMPIYSIPGLIDHH